MLASDWFFLLRGIKSFSLIGYDIDRLLYTTHMEESGMLVVLLRGVKYGFWSHLWYSGLNAIIFIREGLVLFCTGKNIKLYICLSFKMVYFRDKKNWSRPDWSRLGSPGRNLTKE